MAEKQYKPDIDKVEILVPPQAPPRGYGVRVYLHHWNSPEVTTLFTNDTYSKERAEGFKQWLTEHLNH